MNQQKKLTILALLAILVVCIAVVAGAAVMMLRGDKPSSSTPADTNLPIGDDIVDAIDLTPAVADRLSVQNGSAHTLTLSHAVTATLNASTGTLSEDYEVITFEGKGATAEWTMDMSNPVPENGEDPILLAITEIHRENCETLAYRVYVNGELTYFRTYQQIASAPNQYYIFLDRAKLGNLSKVAIKIESESKTVFSIASVVAYTDLFGSVEREGMDTDLTLYLHSAASLDKAKGHIEDFAGHEYDLYKLGLLFKLDYMNMPTDSSVGKLAEYLALAAKHDMALQIMPTIYWGSPLVADGKGGFFTDAKYQQVSYNSLDGKYYGTNPNVYSSTTWVTSGSDLLNGACATRLQAVFSTFNGILSQYRNQGSYSLPLSIVMEHGVCYKALGTSKAIAANALDGGDFNPFVVAKAKADGVNLDPTDGLSQEEKLWLIKNHANYNQGLADAYHAALGSESILVSGDDVVYPTFQTTDQIFTHGVQWVERHPSNSDILVSGWKSGVGSGMYSSSEDMYWDDVRFYQYKASYGRVGIVNFEVSYSRSNDLNDLLRKSYELGFEYLTLFNDTSDYHTADLVKRLDNIDEEKGTYTVNHYDRAILAADFNRDTTVEDVLERYGITEMQNLVYDRVNGVLKVKNGAADGYVVLKLTDGGDAFTGGLRLFVESKANDGSITFHGSADGTSFKSLGKAGLGSGLNYVNSFRGTDFDLKKDTKGLTTYYIKIDLTANATLKAINAFSVFELTSGQQNGFTPTRGEYRILSLVTQKERLAQNMMNRYLDKNGHVEDAVTETMGDAIANGLYISAYKQLSKAVSATLPASFNVDGEGTLGYLPLHVKVKNKGFGQVTVHACSSTAVEMTFVSSYAFNEKARQMTVTASGMEDGAYTLISTGFNRYRLEKKDGGELAAENGTVTFTVTADYGDRDQVYTTVEGRVMSQNGTVLTLIVQDPRISGYARTAIFQLAPNYACTRGPEGGEMAEATSGKAGDYAKLTFDEDGKLVASVEFIYGSGSGKVKQYIAPEFSDPDTENGLIVLEDGRIFEFDYLDTTTMLTANGETKNVRNYTDADITSLLLGETVTFTYCPEYYGNYQRLLTIMVEG